MSSAFGGRPDETSGNLEYELGGCGHVVTLSRSRELKTTRIDAF